MADVRALLKAKREEQRIVHPFAVYNQSGALRCTVCSTVIKHASAWNGHLGSKSHRTNAARLKEEERLRDEEGKRQAKRKIDEDEDSEATESAKKRRVDEDRKEQRPHLSTPPASAFPADFFSDPLRSVAIDEAESDEDADENNPLDAKPTPQLQPSLDLEWARFQEAVINVPVESDKRETFERATIFAEPQLSMEIPEGFPSSVAPGEMPHRTASPAPKSEEAERRKRAEEEKELIMDRLLDEERVQEEADERVNALKAKLELLKQKRIAAMTARAKK